MHTRYCLALDLQDDPALIAEYEAHHRRVWPEVVASIRRAGVVSMAIYRRDTRLVMLMEVDETFSFERKAAFDAADPAVQAWEALMWKYQRALPGAPPGSKWQLLDKIFDLPAQAPEPAPQPRPGGGSAMSRTIVVATEKPFAKVAVSGIAGIFRDAGYQCRWLERYTDKADYVRAVADADGLIVRSDIVDAEVLDAAPALKIVVRAGAGYDNIDLKAASARGIVAMNTPGQNSNAVAELVFALMLTLARRGFTGKDGTELRGKTIGIHAYGHVGARVAAIARGFGMEACAYDPYVPAARIEADGVTPLSSADELYRLSDYISLHLPKTKDTVQSVGYALLSQAKPTATLVNTARAEVVDEAGLMQVMSERQGFLYGADVAPARAAEFTEKFPGRCVFTAKKMGAQTAEANINAGLAAARQIVGFFERGDATFRVN
ncbi:MAG TPA: NAD(P)-dependent oxidoreductase [Vicinamibacterales bacterium]|nr:NAD(P)-dependent oxidoreductase [Vicinamibacterales bacterium]HPW20811.1 NAD(P)-dependent oxidoreductase [Vicinamibacterales bacterium]